MADIRLFTQQFNGTPAAQLTIVQPSGTTEYLPYGKDQTVYIGSSDTVIAVKSSEIATDTGVIFRKVWAALRSRHYPIIAIDSSKKVFTFTGQDITESAGTATGKYYFISQEDGATEYLEVSDTGCTFTESSEIPVIEVDESAIIGGTSKLWEKVNPVNGKCTIAVISSESAGLTMVTEYFSLDSRTAGRGDPAAYRFMSQRRWLDVTVTGDSLSAIETSQEVIYVPFNNTSPTAIAAMRLAIDNALASGKFPILVRANLGIRTYFIPASEQTGLTTMMVNVSETAINTATFNGDGTLTMESYPLSGSSYTARSPLHISESNEIYMDPVGASPLSNISTPPLDVLASTAPAALGGGHGNGWCSLDGHLFSIPNYFAPESTDFFEYIVTQSQAASAVSTHYLAIYELDETNRQLNLCILSQNAAAQDTAIGVVSVPVGYIDPVYGTIKPSRLYYACHICDQTAVNVAGLTGSTFNLNPTSASQPIGITKTTFCATASDGSIDTTAIKTVPLSNFGMLAERHFVGLKHQV